MTATDRETERACPIFRMADAEFNQIAAEGLMTGNWSWNQDELVFVTEDGDEEIVTLVGETDFSKCAKDPVFGPKLDGLLEVSRRFIHEKPFFAPFSSLRTMARLLSDRIVLYIPREWLGVEFSGVCDYVEDAFAIVYRNSIFFFKAVKQVQEITKPPLNYEDVWEENRHTLGERMAVINPALR